MRRTLAQGAAVVLVAALALRVAVLMEPGLDYFTDAGGPIDSLVRGDLDTFFANQPLMGTFSLVLRAPFVALVFHSSEAVVYMVGALPLVLSAVILGLALARLVAERGHGTAVQGAVAGLAIFNPVTFKALHWGHPEELLGAALCAGAVLAALRDRAVLAGVLLGLALATKQWAVIAVLPVLLAASERRLLTLGLAGAIASALTLPLLLGNAGAFHAASVNAAGHAAQVADTTPWNVWWPIAELTSVPVLGERYLAPGWVRTISHPLIVLIAIPLSALLWRRRDRRRDDALLLLALLFLLRCLLDNWSNDYYHAPFLLALLTWETVRRPGLPVLSLGVAALLGISFWPQYDQMFGDSAPHAALLNAIYLSWSIPLAVGLALALYAPGRLAGLRSRLAAIAAAFTGRRDTPSPARS
jgi:hypothetical protein